MFRRRLMEWFSWCLMEGFRACFMVGPFSVVQMVELRPLAERMDSDAFTTDNAMERGRKATQVRVNGA